MCGHSSHLSLSAWGSACWRAGWLGLQGPTYGLDLCAVAHPHYVQVWGKTWADAVASQLLA